MILKNYNLIFEKSFSHQNINTSIIDEEKEININVQKEIKKSLKKISNSKENLYKETLLGLVGYRSKDNKLYFTLKKTDYKEYYGTNLKNPWIKSVYGSQYMSNALRINISLITNDDKLIILKNDMFDGFSLFFSFDKHIADNRPDIYFAVEEHLKSEFNFTGSEINRTEFLSIAYNYNTLCSEIFVKTLLNIDSKKLLDKHGSDKFHIISKSQNDIEQFIVSQRNNSTQSLQTSLISLSRNEKYFEKIELIKKSSFFPKKKPTVALVLGGGMAKGFAHIGVLSVLEKEGIFPDYIIGNSIGALVGSAYAARVNIKELEEAGRNFHWKDIADWEIPKRSLLKGEKLGNYIQKLVSVNSFNSLRIPLAVVSTDLITGEEVIFASDKILEKKRHYSNRSNINKDMKTNVPLAIQKEAYEKSELVSAVRASCSFPGIFSPVKINNRILSDGVTCDNVPVKIARRINADFIIVVDLSIEKLPQSMDRLINIFIRAQALQNLKLLSYQLYGADIVIRPDLSKFWVTDFEYFEDMYNAGKDSALRMMPVIKRAFKKKTGYSFY